METILAQILAANTHVELDHVVGQIVGDEAAQAAASGETYTETADRYEQEGRTTDAMLLNYAETRWHAIVDGKRPLAATSRR